MEEWTCLIHHEPYIICRTSTIDTHISGASKDSLRREERINQPSDEEGKIQYHREMSSWVWKGHLPRPSVIIWMSSCVLMTTVWFMHQNTTMKQDTYICFARDTHFPFHQIHWTILRFHWLSEKSLGCEDWWSIRVADRNTLNRNSPSLLKTRQDKIILGHYAIKTPPKPNVAQAYR